MSRNASSAGNGDYTESARRETARDSDCNVNDLGVALGVAPGAITEEADFANRRGAKPATAAKPSNFAKKFFRDGS